MGKFKQLSRTERQGGKVAKRATVQHARNKTVHPRNRQKNGRLRKDVENLFPGNAPVDNGDDDDDPRAACGVREGRDGVYRSNFTFFFGERLQESSSPRPRGASTIQLANLCGFPRCMAPAASWGTTCVCSQTKPNPHCSSCIRTQRRQVALV